MAPQRLIPLTLVKRLQGFDCYTTVIVGMYRRQINELYVNITG